VFYITEQGVYIPR